MSVQTSRDPWHTTWQIVTSDILIATLLLGIAIGVAITTWLPQTPSSDEPVAYAQWLSQVQTRFRDAAPLLQAVGLFHITRSIGFRVLVALLAGCLLARSIEIGDRLQQQRALKEPDGAWHSLAGVHLTEVLDLLRRRRYRILNDPPLFQVDRWPWANLCSLSAHGGGLLLLASLLITLLWGWRIDGLVIQGNGQVALPGRGKWVAIDQDPGHITHSPGIVTTVQERGPGVRVNVTDSAGRRLPLKQTTQADPATQLTIALDQDQTFAIPDAQLIVRLRPQFEHNVESTAPVTVQIYHSPPGWLETEATIQGDTTLTAADVTLEFASVPYVRLTAVFNPGRWLGGIGVILLLVGLLSSTLWPTRRFWLRAEGDSVTGAGDLPPVLARKEDS